MFLMRAAITPTSCGYTNMQIATGTVGELHSYTKLSLPAHVLDARSHHTHILQIQNKHGGQGGTKNTTGTQASSVRCSMTHYCS
jgi:hypothetical protein